MRSSLMGNKLSAAGVPGASSLEKKVDERQRKNGRKDLTKKDLKKQLDEKKKVRAANLKNLEASRDANKKRASKNAEELREARGAPKKGGDGRSAGEDLWPAPLKK